MPKQPRSSVGIMPQALKRSLSLRRSLHSDLFIGFVHIADDGLPAVRHTDVLDPGNLLTAMTHHDTPFEAIRFAIETTVNRARSP